MDVARRQLANSLYHADANSGPESMMSSSGNLVSHSGPRHPRMAAEQTRLLTFRDWPNAMPQKPKDLAAAGFFYLGKML